MARKPAETPERKSKTAASGKTNMINPEKAQQYFKQYEELETERVALHSSYMANARSVREDMRQVVATAKDAGIPQNIFRAELAERAAKKKRDERLSAILANPDDAMMWRELRKFFDEDVDWIPEAPPVKEPPAELGPTAN